MNWRETLASAKKAVHTTFAIPVTVHFPGGALTINAKHHRAGAVVGEEGYAQAIVTDDRLVFMVEDLAGNPLTRGLTITTPGGVVTTGDVMPVDINEQAVVVA